MIEFFRKLFWRKDTKVDHKPEINFMHCRLMSLSYKLDALTKHGKYDSEALTVQSACLDYSVDLMTSLGKRHFHLSLLPLLSASHTISMFDGDRMIFKVVTQRDFIRVEPVMQKGGLNAHKIDLAIYELEQVVDAHYKEFKRLDEFHVVEASKLQTR